MQFDQSRRLAVIFAMCAPLALPGTAAAAGSNTIASPWVHTYGDFGPRHSLNLVDALVSTNWADNACINALNDSDGQWAGTTYCTTGAHGTGFYTSHSYCACTLRYGFAYSATGADSNGSSKQFW